MSALISVIVPVYNVRSYLAKCVDTIINQTYRNLEIILVNDGSTDGSGELCDELSVIDARIKVIHKKNGGLSDARNAGLDIAKGEYVAFVDSDDYIHTSMYEVLYQALIENGCDIAEAGHQEVFDNQEIMEDTNDSQTIYGKKEALVSSIMDHHCRTYVWNKLYKMELWKDIRFPYGKLFEDTATTYLILDKADKLVKLDRKFYYYYQRQNSIVNSDFSIRKLDHCEALDNMMTFMGEKYPDVAPLISIKYYVECLSYLQDLLDHRKKLDNVDFHIRNLSYTLINKRYTTLLAVDIQPLCTQLLKHNYEELFKQKRRIRIKVQLLKKSVWLLNSFNLSVRTIKKPLVKTKETSR